MKQYITKLTQLLLCCLVFAGCDKYLDITPKGKRLLTTVADYDQWLADESLIYGVGTPYGNLNYFGDNVDAPNVAVPAVQPIELVYTWAQQYSTDINVAPMFWSDHYAKINKFNTVINGVDQATGGTNKQRSSLKAEALLGRAFEYFYLVNEYGASYDSATAVKDLAVPFMVSNDVSQVVPDRSTVAEIYTHMITDLNNAIPDLPDDNSANRFRGSKAAAYSLLARIYFYARNYPEAQKNAELAMENTRAVMIDFNGALPASDMLSIRPDVIYGKMVLGSNTATLDFMRSFASNDLRVKILYYSTDGYKFTTRGTVLFMPAYTKAVLQYTNMGTSVSEMKLIIAESAARSNNLTVALQQLDEVRKTRFAAASYVPFNSTDATTVLNEVLAERYHELAFCSLRWFDMRRLDKENRMGTVNRYNAQGAVIATLEPHSSRYTLQIPVQVLSFNPGMQQNP